jgi:hypothetical protein
MTERDEQRGGAGVGCFVIGVIGVMLPLLYVLSLGPAVWLERRFPSISAAVGVIYYPLQFLANNSEPARRVLRSYVDFFN